MPRFIGSKGVKRGRDFKHRVIIRTQTPGMDGVVAVDTSASARIRRLRTFVTILGQPQGQAQSSQAQYEITFGTEVALVASNLIIHNDIEYKVVSVMKPPDEPLTAICTVG